MERSEFVQRYNDLLTSKQSFEKVSELIAEYCRISNKSEEDIQKLLEFLKTSPFIVSELLDISLKGLSKHHNIISLISENRLIKIY